MNISQKVLSDITVYLKYARYIPELNRRETWDEIVTRNKQMHIKKFPNLKDEIDNAYKYVYERKILPSMRSMQFAGKAIEISPSRIYNCAYCPVNDWRVFSEIMFLLLGGTGVGFSVQQHHIEELPYIQKPRSERQRRYLIGDSIEGRADAIKVLMKSYFFGGSKIKFDFSDIRPKGSLLVTAGGKAPGPQPLKECLIKIEGILEQKRDGEKLTSIEVHDIICHIADAVLAGGIRRAALLSLFSADDDDMISAKAGKWWELNPQRGRANNSAVLVRHRIEEDYFFRLWDKIKASGAGEPGIFFTNDKDYGTNPCCEISLRPFSFCNLTEINVSDIIDNDELFNRAKAAAFIGTLQATYTDFHYLRPIWRRQTEKDYLIGVSLTGIASNNIYDLDLNGAASVVKDENLRVSKIVNIKSAARTTTVKPSGTASLVLGTSSGIHAWHSKYYIRRIRISKNESIYSYLIKTNPDLVVDEYFRPHDTAIIEIPQMAPVGAITRSESPIQLLNRVKYVFENWVKVGHRRGPNKNNVSVTVSVRDHEWDAVGRWMWENMNYYNGISVLPFDGGTYIQAPFEECNVDVYNNMMEKLKDIDLSKICEYDDNTVLVGELACAGGACEII